MCCAYVLCLQLPTSSYGPSRRPELANAAILPMTTGSWENDDTVQRQRRHHRRPCVPAGQEVAGTLEAPKPLRGVRVRAGRRRERHWWDVAVLLLCFRLLFFVQTSGLISHFVCQIWRYWWCLCCLRYPTLERMWWSSSVELLIWFIWKDE